MRSNVWSFTSLDYVRPSGVVLHSVCKHAPLRSLTVVSPHEPAAVAQITIAPRPPQQSQQHVMQYPRTAEEQWQEQQQWSQLQQQEAEQEDTLTWADASQLAAELTPAVTKVPAAEQLQLPPPAALRQQQEQHVGGADPAQEFPMHAAATDAAAPGSRRSNASSRSAGSRSGTSSSSRQAGWHQQPPAQPPAMWRLMAAARRHQSIGPEQLAVLLDELQPLLKQLPATHLAQAAWGAAVLAQQQSWRQQQLPSPQWQQHLLDAASSHFCSRGSLDAATAATLLQALVKLQLYPGEVWLAACCSSMAVGQWSDPRGLSSVAACLARLDHVPQRPWLDAFFAASATHMQAFPAISLARMLHAAVAWQSMHWPQQPQQQQQQQHLQQQEPGPLLLPDDWLLAVLHSLHTCSSNLKPPELAMLLQSMHRLQQHQPVLPAAGLSPTTAVQQAAVQLHHALMAGVAQQLSRFSGKDLTVTLQAAAALQQQRQQQQQQQQLQAAADSSAVSWHWVRQVLTAAQVMLPRLDARGQATCLSAAAALIKPHLQHQQQQQQQRDAAAAAADHHHQQQPQQQQQAHAREGRLKAAPGQPPLVKPLQRWLLLQQGADQQQQQQGAPSQQAAQQQPAPPSGSVDVALSLSSATTSSSSSSGADPAGFWLCWLDALYSSSLPALDAYSCEDLVQSALALATLGTVPPLPWYEALLAALQQQAVRALQRGAAQQAAGGGVPLMTHRQAAGAAWALGRLALLPSQHNAGVSLVPSPGWLQCLYAAATAAAVGTYTRGQPLGAAEGDSSGSSSGSGGSVGDVSEVVRLMWAAGVCDFDPGHEWWAAAERLLLCSQSNGGGANPGGQGRSGQLPARLLGAAVQAYAALQRPIPPPVLLQLVATASVTQQLQQQPLQNTLRLLRGLQQAHCQPPGQWVLQVAAALQGRLAHLTPLELPQLLCCLAGAGFDLTQHVQQQQQQLQQWDDQQAQQLNGVQLVLLTESAAAGDAGSFDAANWQESCLGAAHQMLPHMSAGDISLLLWACARLRLKPPAAWLEVVLQQMQAQFLGADSGALALCLDALGRLGYRTSADWMAGMMMATHRRFSAAAAAAAAAGPGSRSRLRVVQHILQALSGLARLGVSPSSRWIRQQLLLVHGQLPLLQPRHVAALLLALARLGCRPPARFLQNLLDSLGDCSSCSSLDLVHVIYAAAVLRWQPSRPWLVRCLRATVPRMPEMSPQGLALLHWGLAVLRVVPPERWRRAAAAAVCARLPECDARALGMICWSWGRHKMALQPGGSPAAADDAWADPAEQQQALRHELQQAMQQLQHQQSREAASAGGSRDGQPLAVAAGPGVQVPQGRSTCWPWSERQQVALLLLTAAWQLRGSYSAASLVHLVAGVAKMRLQPGQLWLQDMVLQGSHERLSVLTGYELQQLVWALAQLRFRAAQSWLTAVELLLEVRWMQMQKQDGTRHGAAWALQQLQQLALPPAGGSAEECE